MTEKSQNNHYMSGIDEIDKKLLQILQDEFPIVTQPWLEIGNKLNTTETEVIKRLKRLIEANVILRIGPVFEPSKIGLKAGTLVALRVDASRVNDVASIINQYENISHNYEREDEYNIWFTLTAPKDTELNQTLESIKQRAKIHNSNLLNLPTIRRFKINVFFQMTQNTK